MDDGRVEAVAEGEKEKLEQLINYMREGTPYSQVEDVEVKWEKYTGEFGDFRITW